MFNGGQGSDLESRAYLRHIKQHVQAPVHRFVVISPPELTTICYQELVSLGFSQAEITDAGVEFTGKLRSSFLPNLCLHAASRILCRLPPFRAGVVQELFYKVSTCRWELWLNPKIPIEVRAYVRNSRVSHEGLVSQTVMRGIERRFKSHPVCLPTRWISGRESQGETTSTLKQRLLVHLQENHCEISLDTTGDHLHRRGYRLEHSGAPLRETLAAAILLRSRWNGKVPLIDGMCGAGTVSIEAALLARRLPPGLRRTFLFEFWPGFQEKSWEHLRKKLVDQALAHPFVPIIGLDDDPKTLDIARNNAERAGVDGDIQLRCVDFFKFKPRDHHLSPGLLILDPPYGKRLKGGGIDLYEQLGRHLRCFFEGWQAAILTPSKKLALSLKLPSVRFWQISHGGSPIFVALTHL